MTPCEELYDLLTQTVIPEIGNMIKQMEEYTAANEVTPEMTQEYENTKAINENFENIAAAITAKEIETGNCEELLKELNMMRSMGMEAEPEV